MERENRMEEESRAEEEYKIEGKRSNRGFLHRDEHIDEQMILMQANYDDMNPEWYSYVMDRLFEAGANDVYFVPIIMKKGRPGTMLNVLVSAHLQYSIEEIIFTETTTLGVRWMQASCHRLGRDFTKVNTPWGEMSVKIGYYKNKIVQFAPEFDECKRVADTHQVPLKKVYDEVRAAARQVLDVE